MLTIDQSVINQLEDRAVKRLIDLIRFNTVKGHKDYDEIGAIDYVDEILRSMGFSTELRNHGDKGNVNLYAQIGEGKPGCTFNTHIDVVPAEDIGWTKTEPFVGREIDGRVYGRGSADAKGQIVAMIAAAEYFYLSRIQLSTPLALLIVYGEETKHKGIIRERDAGNLEDIDVCIVGEPTDNKPINRHRGCGNITVTTYGESAHSGLLNGGINPIPAIMDFWYYMRPFVMEYRERTHEGFPGVLPRVEETMINAGNANNVIPSVAVLNINYRSLPDGGAEYWQNVVDNHVVNRVQDKYRNVRIMVDITDTPPLATALDSQVVRAASEMFGEPGIAFFCTDAPYFNPNSGIVQGPGRHGDIHIPNESLERLSLRTGIEDKIRYVNHFCL